RALGRAPRSGTAVAALTVVLGLTASACASGASGAASAVAPRYGVGTRVITVTDTSRPTAANGPVAGHPGRTLVVTILYPAAGRPGLRPEPGTPADRRGAPYPLIVFAHGFGSAPHEYEPLLAHWAAAGFVVAAPRFPLTNSATAGGPDLADYVNQPADMSFVVSQVLTQSAAAGSWMSGLADPSAVAAAGHSLGGVTTLGLVANTCCSDPRIDAAVVMAGDPVTFPTGTVRYPRIPLLFVHGSGDKTVPYAASVTAFDAAYPPKVLLTITGGGHSSPVDPGGPAFDDVVRSTVDFFDAYLRHQGAAAGRLSGDSKSGATTVALALHAGDRVRVPVPKTVTGKLSATASPDSGLADGQRVTVSWKGYQPGTSINILECSAPVTGPQNCNLSTATVGQPDPVGSGFTSFVVHTGPVGTGTCDAGHRCVIVVNQGGSTSTSASVLLPVSFAG
ncbi:MAG TPA: neocarzinostatin apoprotein domain-containing protein, partial [Acidimicrobiales bacterium]|nr:neocarzinostatin apoprotein domain-containing protein [Acidimicrobiales bacterium]